MSGNIATHTVIEAQLHGLHGSSSQDKNMKPLTSLIIVLLMLPLVMPTAQASQGVGTSAEVICGATESTAEARANAVFVFPVIYIPYVAVDADGQGFGGSTTHQDFSILITQRHEVAHYRGLYVQATWAAAKAINRLGSVAAACEFDPYDLVDLPPIDLDSAAVGCLATPFDAQRTISGPVGVDAEGTLWAISEGLGLPLSGALAATTALQVPPTLTMSHANYEASWGPDGCTARLA